MKVALLEVMHDQAVQRKPGGGKNQYTECLLDNVQEAPAPVGNSRQRALRKLRKDRPDLLERGFNLIAGGQNSAGPTTK